MKKGLRIIALLALFANFAFATADGFQTFSDVMVGFFTGSLGYLIALFSMVGAIILYAFTHKHSVLFIGFLIAFFAGAGAGIADWGFTLGTGTFTAP